ncbi:MAG: LapA family protein [Magnetococcales bacterium]|nr:LapA family protein [Magnetococcales bacterium]
MLKWLAILSGLFLVVLATLFAIANQGEIDVQMPGSVIREAFSFRAPLAALVYVPLLSGFAIGGILGWRRSVRYRRLAEQLSRQNRVLEQELTNLRNLPLDDDLPI